MGQVKTFAQVAGATPEAAPARVPCIVMRPLVQQDTAEALLHIRKEIGEVVRKPVLSVKNRNNGSIAVKCSDRNDVSVVQAALVQKMGPDFDVCLEKLQKPRLLVAGVENDMTLEQLRQDIYERNLLAEADISVVHAYKNAKNPSRRNIILEVAASAYAKIMCDGNVFVGWQRCKVYNDFNIGYCFNCCGFGHSSKKCANEAVCGKCARNHSTRDCTLAKDAPPCCINCSLANQKDRRGRKTDHEARDYKNCDCYKDRVLKHIHSADYPFQPKFDFPGV